MSGVIGDGADEDEGSMDSMDAVGADAADLPKGNPRAGIFGWNRRTTTDDVRDGLSNTVLTLGIEQGYHSWADGRHGVRAVTTEPYLRDSGPYPPPLK